MILCEDFDTSKLTVCEAKASSKFKKSRFLDNDETPVIEVRGTFKLYKNCFDGKKSFSLGINSRDSSLNFFSLEKKLQELAKESLSISPGLIKKGNRVYCKVMLPEIYDEANDLYVSFEDVVGWEFYGKCRISLDYAFKRKTFGFIIYADRIVMFGTDD